MNQITRIIDFTRRRSYPADVLSVAGPLETELALCPTCESTITVEVLCDFQAILIQFCDLCSARLSVESDGARLVRILDLDLASEIR